MKLGAFLTNAGYSAQGFDAGINAADAHHAADANTRAQLLANQGSRFTLLQANEKYKRDNEAGRILDDTVNQFEAGFPKLDATEIGAGVAPELVYRPGLTPASPGVVAPTASAPAPSAPTGQAAAATPSAPASPTVNSTARPTSVVATAGAGGLPRYDPSRPRGVAGIVNVAGLPYADPKTSSQAVVDMTSIRARAVISGRVGSIGTKLDQDMVAEQPKYFGTSAADAAPRRVRASEIRKARDWYNGSEARNYLYQHPELLEHAERDPLWFYQAYKATANRAADEPSTPAASGATPTASTTPATPRPAAGLNTAAEEEPEQSIVQSIVADPSRNVSFANATRATQREPTLAVKEADSALQVMHGMLRIAQTRRDTDGALAAIQGITNIMQVRNLSMGQAGLAQLEYGDPTMMQNYLSTIMSADVKIVPLAADRDGTMWNHKYGVTINGVPQEDMTVEELQTKAKRTFDPAFRALEQASLNARNEASIELGKQLAVEEAKTRGDLAVEQAKFQSAVVLARAQGRLDAELEGIKAQLKAEYGEGTRLHNAPDGTVYAVNGRQVRRLDVKEVQGPASGGVAGFFQSRPTLDQYTLVPVEQLPANTTPMGQ